MENNCLNCNHTITENFCSHCGQKKYKKIDKKYVFDELQYTVLHANKGFLYSVKNIIKNPGKTARGFIDGNRVNHYKPVLLAFVLSGISAFCAFKIVGLAGIMASYYSKERLSSPFMIDYLSFTSTYHSIIMLLLIPFLALTTNLSFRRWGHNYYEHVVINAYILSFYTLITIVIIYPLMYLFKSNSDLVVSITSLSMLMLPFILTWFFKQFYKERSLKSIIRRILLIFLSTGVGLSILMFIVAIGVVIFAVLKGPEALEYLKSK